MQERRFGEALKLGESRKENAVDIDDLLKTISALLGDVAQPYYDGQLSATLTFTDADGRKAGRIVDGELADQVLHCMWSAGESRDREEIAHHLIKEIEYEHRIDPEHPGIDLHSASSFPIEVEVTTGPLAG